jgi:hypothetical protein
VFDAAAVMLAVLGLLLSGAVFVGLPVGVVVGAAWAGSSRRTRRGVTPAWQTIAAIRSRAQISPDVSTVRIPLVDSVLLCGLDGDKSGLPAGEVNSDRKT